MDNLTLKVGREKLSRTHHPWIYSGALAAQAHLPHPGSLVKVLDSQGHFVAWGHYNPASKLAVRLLSWMEDQVPDETWLRNKIKEITQLRGPLPLGTNAQRLIFGEADGLPGLILDQFGQVGVLQILTLGMEKIAEQLGQWLLEEIPGLNWIWEKSEGDGRSLEGLKDRSGILASRKGDTPPLPVEIQENGHRFLVDLGQQKTGFYTDQRENRAMLARYAYGRSFLDAFSYTGAFSVYALAAGATSAVLLDSSKEALEQAKLNLKLNSQKPRELIVGDAFEELRTLKKSGVKFDLISIDPPKLVKSREHLTKGLRAYKDLNLLGIQLLSPGGVMATFSCSGLVGFEEFRTMVSYAAKDAGISVQILAPLWQSPCHPVLTSYPEGSYLKGLLIRRLL